jgi:hypothetical protein
VLWGDVAAQRGLAGPVGAGQRRRRGRPARSPTATSTPSSALFDAAAGFVDRLPSATVGRVRRSTCRPRSCPASPPPAASRSPTPSGCSPRTPAKGLEWDVVCVAGVQEGIWPDLRDRGTLLAPSCWSSGWRASTALLDRRVQMLARSGRLFYVACTRAAAGWWWTAVEVARTGRTPAPPPPVPRPRRPPARRTAGR